MEILSKLWVAMTTENETIINILLILFLFIEIPITMQIFLTIFNVRSTVKQKLSYLAQPCLLEPFVFSLFQNHIVI